MPIDTLRGLTEETANLPALGNVLAKLLGKDNELQASLRKAIAADPSLASELADLSKSNPQLFGALRLGKFGEQIAKTPPGYKQQKEAQSLEAGKLDIATKQQEFDLNPVRASILNAQKEKLDLDNKQLQEAAKGFPGVNFEKAVTDFTSGQQSPDLQAVMSNPHAMQLFTQMVGWKKQQESLASQEARQDQRLAQQFDLAAQREDRLRNKQYKDEGTAFFKKYGVGTPQTWAQYLSDPTTQNTVDDLVSGKVSPGKDQNLQALMAIGTRLKQDTDMHTQTTVRQNLLGIDRLLKDVQAGKTDRTIGMQSANDLLNANAQLTGKNPVMLVTGDKVPGVSGFSGWMHRNKIVALDPATGKTADIGGYGAGNSFNVDINKLAEAADKAPSGTGHTPQDIQQARNAVKTATPKDIKELKTRDPEMYNILVNSGDIKP